MTTIMIKDRGCMLDGLITSVRMVDCFGLD
jgi:hypothetical protein